MVVTAQQKITNIYIYILRRLSRSTVGPSSKTMRAMVNMQPTVYIYVEYDPLYDTIQTHQIGIAAEETELVVSLIKNCLCG